MRNKRGSDDASRNPLSSLRDQASVPCLGPSGFNQAQARMSDEALAEACCPGEPEADKAAFIATLSSEHRATLERLIWVGDELNAGRVPPGVLI